MDLAGATLQELVTNNGTGVATQVAILKGEVAMADYKTKTTPTN